MMTPVKIPFNPRHQQKELYTTSKRFNVNVCHRRFGKTVYEINKLIRMALTCDLPNPRYAYIAPFYRQAKNVAWDYLKHFTRPIPGTIWNEAELRADLPNGARITLYGGEPDNLRGLYLDGVVLDEYAQINPRMWAEVIRPALSDRKGWADFIGTPQGHNNFYELYQHALSDDDWTARTFKASETGIVDSEELKAAARDMTPEQYDQEFECSWSAAIRGAYYGKLMTEMEDDGRICAVPYDPSMRVITSWDLGISDATVIWFWQVSRTEIRAINCLSFQGAGLPEIIKIVNSMPYDYVQHIAPHDIAVRELGSGNSRIDIARDLGIKFEVAKKTFVADGINAVRMLLPKVWIDAEKCKTGIEALRLYRTEYDDKKMVFKDNPLHDWTSDFTDSVRYFAVTKHKTEQFSGDDWNESINR